MRVDSLARLESAFRDWRRRKRHVRERIPEDLLERARRAISVHGAWRVGQTTGIEHSRLTKGSRKEAKVPRRATRKTGAATSEAVPLPAKSATQPMPAATRSNAAKGVPAYTRLALPAPSSARPVAEVETTAGTKLRIFEVTPETVQLVSTLCQAGGAR